MCVLDGRPFNITHGKGFEEFSKQIFDAGKYFGKMIDVKQLLPYRTTVRNAFIFFSCLTYLFYFRLVDMLIVCIHGIINN
jgi:hypothetical protein